MFEMMGEDIHDMELHGLLAPFLADGCAAFFAFLGGSIDGVKDRHASKVREPNRAAVLVKIVEGRRSISRRFSLKMLNMEIPLPIPSARKVL
jgi:hypothetical protein